MSRDEELERALKVLGPLEGRIMRAAWSGSVRQPFTVRDIQQVTPELAYTTLMTTLSRLAEKGILTQDRVSHQRAFEYRAAGTPVQFLAAASREQAQPLALRAEPDAGAVRGCGAGSLRRAARRAPAEGGRR